MRGSSVTLPQLQLLIDVGLEAMEEEIIEPAARPDADEQQDGFLPEREVREQLQDASEQCEKGEEDAFGRDPAFAS